MRRPWIVIAAGVLVVAVGGAGVALIRSEGSSSAAPAEPVGCVATADGKQYLLDQEQAANAATIAAVAARRGLANHAVTVALAAAMQESRLYNVGYGDRDSLGLFQQRPSQGWGTQAQVQDPVYAANAFYRELTGIKGWAALPITVAAQRVQRSAYPNAYAQWEDEARILARALTGEVPAGLACAFPSTAGGSATVVAEAVTRALGRPSLGRTVSAVQGWATASWLVAHAEQLHVQQVTFAGRTWTAAAATWSEPAPGALKAGALKADALKVTFALAPPPSTSS